MVENKEQLINIIADSLKRFNKDFLVTTDIDNYEEIAHKYLKSIEEKPDLLINSKIDIDNSYSKLIFTYEGTITLQNEDSYEFVAEIIKKEFGEDELIECKIIDTFRSNISEAEVKNHIVEYLTKLDKEEY